MRLSLNLLFTASALIGMSQSLPTTAATPDPALQFSGGLDLGLDIVSSLVPAKLLDPTGLLEGVFGTLAKVLLLYPGSAGFKAELLEFWSLGNQAVVPQVIVKPKSSAEAAKAIKTLTENGVAFGIRSGGHTPNPGWNSSPQVLIALSSLNTISFPRSGIASIGPGLRWGDVYAKLRTRGETCLGGRYAKVGVGGFLTGGGLSHLSNEYGYAADMLVNVEVVLADGSVVNANQTANEELFWAVKGGSNNFGLITRFDIRTVSQPGGIWGGMLTIAPQNVPRLLEALADWQLKDQAKDLKAAVLISMIKGAYIGSPTATLASVTLYYGAPVRNPEVLRRFWEIPALTSSLRMTTHQELAEELAAGDNNKKRHLFYTGTYKASAKMNAAALDQYITALDKTGMATDPTAYTAFTLQPISKSMLTVGEGQHAIGELPADGGPYVWYSIHIEWTNPALSAPLETFAQSIQNEIQKTATKVTGVNVEYLFLNDAGAAQKPLRSYGMNNFRKLKRIAREYDPKGTFSQQCKGFKLVE